jgi:hypothetical protein
VFLWTSDEILEGLKPGLNVEGGFSVAAGANKSSAHWTVTDFDEVHSTVQKVQNTCRDFGLDCTFCTLAIAALYLDTGFISFVNSIPVSVRRKKYQFKIR